MSPETSETHQSPLRLLTTIVGAIFLAEVVAMIVVFAIQPIPYYQATLIDAAIIAVLLFPVLYFLSFRPLLSHIAKRRQAEEKQSRAYEELELRVQERTEQLRRANTDLEQEIAERERAEQALRVAHDQLELRIQERTRELADSNQTLLTEIAERKEIERTLQVQTTALESAANGVIITGRDGRIRWANPAFLEMTGYSREEVLGQTPRILKSGQHDAVFYQSLWQTILDEKVWRGEIVNRRKDGSLYMEEQTITPLINENGEIANFIAIKQDITERKRIQDAFDRERTKLRKILDTMPDGIYIVNRQYEIEYINPVIEGEFGPVEGRKCYSYFHEREQVCPWCRNDEVFSGKAVHWEWRSEKTKKTYDLFDAPMINADGSVSKLELFHDITQRKEAEVELERRNLELQAMSEAEIEQRQVAETLRVAAQALTARLELDYVICTLLTHIGPLVRADATSVILVEGESLLSVPAVERYEQWADPRRVLSIKVNGKNNPLYQRLLSTRKSMLIPDTLREPYWEVYRDAQPIRNCLFVPIVVEDKIIGVIALGKIESGYFNDEHVRWSEVLVGQAAVAIQNAWLFEQVRSGRERLQSLSRRLVEIQETERRFIARELHDHAGQSLTSLILGLGALEKAANNPREVRNRAVQLKHMTDSVLEELHRLAINLRPASLDQLGLVPALEQLIKTFMQDSHPQIRFKAVGMYDDDRLAQNVETSLYRIAQEALTNVIRHAAARRVDLMLERRSNSVIILVEDNGKGFDVEHSELREHLGLLGMKERAEMLGGKLTVESVPGKGTTLVVEVPYAHPNHPRG